jgi:hypothetical protein
MATFSLGPPKALTVLLSVFVDRTLQSVLFKETLNGELAWYH